MTSTDRLPVGIDAMAFHGPEHYVDMAELATARGVDPAKFLHGLGQKQMAMPTPCEDTVSMAAAAGHRALTAFDIDPAEIGMLIVGTETGVDHSKPVAVYVHDLLGLPERCRTFETKHACYGAMAGLTSATDWIAAGRARGRKAFADGHYSISCYLDALSGTLADARDKAATPGDLALSAMQACFYHVPFVKMARKAHHRHWEAELGRDIGQDDAVQAAIATSYETRVAPWLGLNAVVGNIYTGSLFLALIDYARRLDRSAEDRPVSLFSYGSGCGAAFCLGRIRPGAASHAARLDPQDALARRRKLDIPAYEAMLAACEAADTNAGAGADPAAWQLEGDFFYAGTRDHVRRYARSRSAAA